MRERLLVHKNNGRWYVRGYKHEDNAWICGTLSGPYETMEGAHAWAHIAARSSGPQRDAMLRGNWRLSL